nr:putative receptor-like protein kinase At4g00960 [Ipomoea batatas]
MGSQKWLVFACLSCIILLAIAQPELSYSKCGESGNYTQNSIYQSNLNTVLSSLSSNLNQYGFSNVSMGENPDRVSAVALCRGDVEPDICHSCVEDAGRKTVQWCPNQTEALGGYDECMIYYSNNVSTVGSWSTRLEIYLRNVENSSSTEEFNKDLQELLESLRDRAANGFSLRKFAAGNKSGPAFQTIYAAVQCSPELSAQACSDCLVSAFADLARCDQCTGKIGGGVAWTQWQEGTALNLVDPFLRGNSGSSVREILRCIHMALLCVQENVGDRPTMSTILLMLSGSSLSLPLPSAPAFFMQSTINPEAPLLLNETAYSSQNEASITDLYPR